MSWNPFIHFLHTIHIIPPPDIVTGWHILCLIYFLCTIQALIKQEQRSPHSWFLSLHQLPEGCSSTLFTPAAWPSGFIIGQRARDPSPIFRFLDTFWVNDHLLQPPTAFLDHMLSVPTQSLDKWNIIIFYILNRPTTLPNRSRDECLCEFSLRLTSPLIIFYSNLCFIPLLDCVAPPHFPESRVECLSPLSCPGRAGVGAGFCSNQSVTHLILIINH